MKIRTLLLQMKVGFLVF